MTETTPKRRFVRDLESLKSGMMIRGLSPAEEWDGGESTVRSINAWMMRTAVYAYDKDNSPTEYVDFEKGDPEHWRSHATGWLQNGTFTDDCDGYALTGVHMAIAMGVPRENLWFCVVASENQVRRHKELGVTPRQDHFVAIFKNQKAIKTAMERPSIYCFDTWDQGRLDQNPRVDGERHYPSRLMNLAKPGEWLVPKSWSERFGVPKMEDYYATQPKPYSE